MELIIHPRAAQDAREIGKRYREISENLYQRFWDELDEAIDLIEAHPERHHFDPSGMRRSNLKKFPYHILFEERLANYFPQIISQTNYKRARGKV